MKTVLNEETQRTPEDGAQGSPAGRQRPASEGSARTSHLTPRTSEGVALIITLIMLAVITFMAVTFLVLSNRERNSVATTTDQTTARFTADSGLDRAKAEILARIISLTNDQNFDLIVSTNFNTLGGFQTGVSNPTNISYYYANGNPLTGNDPQLNIGNLFYNPRPPVFVTTNRNPLTPLDFRYYLDLNRNGRHDPSGLLPVISSDPNNPYFNATNGLTMRNPIPGITSSNFFVGDPEWIGVLERPDRPHSANNKFLARYAFLVTPAGKTLDVNCIHNDSALGVVNNGFSYRRNMGVGTWEMNLAAFLADLNTNQWDSDPAKAYYQYDPLSSPDGIANGHAFEDAQSLLNYRYNYIGVNSPWSKLQNLKQLFSPAAISIIQHDLIDEFGSGVQGLPVPLYFTGIRLPATDGDNRVQRVAAGWPGADNPNHFFTPQEFFDPAKTSTFFTNRLVSAGTNISSYDRYTFYRMLAQLGTDSAPEQKKININYANVDTNGNFVPNMQTNFIPWTPNQFFNLAADRLLRTNTTIWLGADSNSFYNTFAVTNFFGLTTNAFGVTGIPVFASNNLPVTTNVVYGYTPGVHRLLQLAANIYDATTNRFPLGPLSPPTVTAPTVFRPIFRRNPGPRVTHVFIVGYREVKALPNGFNYFTRVLTQPSASQMIELGDNASMSQIPVLGTPFNPNPPNELASVPLEPMVYGIPLVIGAKKGFPNFNQFALQNSVTVTRKLDFHRFPGQPLYGTNQTFILGITNSFGAQAWNSYLPAYSNNLQMILAGDVFLSLTNEFGPIVRPDGSRLTNDIPFYISTNFSRWPGFVKYSSLPPVSFMVPLLTNYLFVSNWVYFSDQHRFVTNATADAMGYFPVPNWILRLKTRVRYLLIDTAANRIVDYVNLSSLQDPLDIMALMRKNAPCDGNFPVSGDPDPGSLWCTNRAGNPHGLPVADNPFLPTYGIMNQMQLSEGSPLVSQGFWRNYSPQTLDVNGSIGLFTQRMFGDPSTWTSADDLDFSTPFNPTRTFYQYLNWQANDPLVHYTIPDLTDLLAGTNVVIQWDLNTASPVPKLTGPSSLAEHYRPWAGNPRKPGIDTTPSTIFVTAVKDPLIKRSDDWDFPTNKFPNAGWLGRVHRGSPWQTVYLKSLQADPTTWTKWSGTTNVADAVFMSSPTNDRVLFDMFTTAINDNATRGQLSVNQTNLAAWSAVLSGVFVLSNTLTDVTFTNIQPAGVFDPLKPPPLVQIVNGINNARANLINFPNGGFTHAGDVLATPELTERSPFINTNHVLTLSDEVLERIPQQIMSLLNFSHTPRFVVYSYGQTLHPAEQSIVTSGPFVGLCTNYQVTAETATRAVVRVEGAPENPHIVVEQFNVLPPD